MKGEAERESQAESLLSKEPHVGFNFITLRSRPEQKSKIERSTNCTTQALLISVLFYDSDKRNFEFFSAKNIDQTAWNNLEMRTPCRKRVLVIVLEAFKV